MSTKELQYCISSRNHPLKQCSHRHNFLQRLVSHRHIFQGKCLYYCKLLQCKCILSQPRKSKSSRLLIWCCRHHIRLYSCDSSLSHHKFQQMLPLTTTNQPLVGSNCHIYSQVINIRCRILAYPSPIAKFPSSQAGNGASSMPSPHVSLQTSFYVELPPEHFHPGS